MKPAISIGIQDFEKLRASQSFYIDKTGLIREWWEKQDEVTLITRPRRFGKTLNLDMMKCFFSSQFAGRGDLFEGLFIWSQEEYRKIQGTWPVIFLSFAGVKANTIRGAKDGIINAIANAYDAHAYLKDSQVLSQADIENFDMFHNYSIEPSPAQGIRDFVVAASLQKLSSYLERYYGKKVLIFLDEYDTPLQEAYVFGYWNELTIFIRQLFNLTFKDNKKLQRALLTGITRVSKESIFSDLNNLMVVTTTSGEYESAFGFTEAEVFAALEEREMSAHKEQVKNWYDGFTFGKVKDIYNPWSITMFLRTGEYGTYWADSSSNALVSELIRQGTPELKMQMEDLLQGNCLEMILDEQVIFEQLKRTKGAIWSLLVASGYLKPVSRTFQMDTGKFCYRLTVTNYETMLMFRKMISDWFPEDCSSYGDFQKALLQGDLRYMNYFMSEIAKVMFSSFDSGNHPSGETQPERFYHGFVLGLIVDLTGRYHIRSNRESGFGRYDVMMEPKNQSDPAIVMEFKVQDEDKEKELEDTVRNALRQIETKEYDTELMARGILKGRIRHYGFAFRGKKVLIGEQMKDD